MTDPVSDLDDAQDREDHDAAAPPRRTWRRWWPLLLLLIPVVLWLALCGEEPPPPPPPPPPPAVVELPALPPILEPPPSVIEAPRAPTTPKKKPPQASRPTKPSRPAVEAVGSTVVVAGAQGGGASVRKAAERALRNKLSSVEAPASEANYSLTVQIEESKANADEVTVRCVVSIALLPKKNLVASLKARADAAGEGTPTDELFEDAATACGQSLGGDIRAWLKSH